MSFLIHHTRRAGTARLNFVRSWTRACACAFGVAALGLGGCARELPETPAATAEAYSLMDKGENAKAVLILEKALQKDPDNEEARVLLASAYVGQAGVDLFSIYDGFKDILFGKPLSESLLGSRDEDDGKDKDKDKASEKKLPEESDEDEQEAEKLLQEGQEGIDKKPDATKPETAKDLADRLEKTEVQKMIHRLDNFMGKTKTVTSYLNRFPKVAKKDWPMLDRALEHLDMIQPKEGRKNIDVRMYRLFIRVIYIKAFIDEEVIRDRKFGSKEWRCGITLQSLQETVYWIAFNLNQMVSDYQAIFPDKAFAFVRFQVAAEMLTESIEGARKQSRYGGNTLEFAAESRLRKELGCDSR